MLLIVLPSYRPGACGVSDHLDILANACRSIGESVQFCVGLDVAAAEISKASSKEIVFLPVVLFGYNRYAIPTRLVGLAKQARNRGLRITSYFHELPATFFPLRRVSVLIPLQAIVCWLLATHSDVVFVNQARGLRWLRDAADRAPFYAPTWSGVGEAEKVLDVQFRHNRIVVFGRKRERMYARLKEAGGPQALFGVDSEIIDIGEPINTFIPESWNVRNLGQLDSAAVGSILAEAKYGLFAAPSGETSKSSVFAACCAYGAIPVNVEPQRRSILLQDPRLGQEFTDLTSLPTDIKALQHLQCSARAWHAKYSVSLSTARVLAGMGLHK